MQIKLLSSLLIVTAAGLTACANVNESRVNEVAANEVVQALSAQQKEYAIEQNEEGVFIICELPCLFASEYQQPENLDEEAEQQLPAQEQAAALAEQDKSEQVAMNVNQQDAASSAAQQEDLKTNSASDLDVASQSPVYTAVFEFNEHQLDAEETLELQEYFISLDKAEVRLSGFTDDIGPEDYNLKLAQRRIDEVAKKLTQLGFEVVETRALGKCCYLSTNETPEGRRANRRVEVFFINNQEEVNDDANQF